MNFEDEDANAECGDNEGEGILGRIFSGSKASPLKKVSKSVAIAI